MNWLSESSFEAKMDDGGLNVEETETGISYTTPCFRFRSLVQV